MSTKTLVMAYGFVILSMFSVVYGADVVLPAIAESALPPIHQQR